MAQLEFLSTPDQFWTDHHEAWEREENRLYGDDAVLPELTKFGAEDEKEYDLRKRTARYDNFCDLHAGLLSGHLRRKMPLPNLADLGGEPRDRGKITGLPKLSEVLVYNCDGIGVDGSQLAAWVDGVEKRAIATSLRYVFIDLPTLDDLVAIRIGLGMSPEDPRIRSLTVTDEERANGWHPFFEEIAPGKVTRALYEKNVLKYAVIDRVLPQDTVAEEDGTLVAGKLGKLLLVRAGYRGLGERFAAGGWWIFDENHEVFRGSDNRAREGRWEMTKGQIPLVRAIGETSQGTTKKPAVARSLTMMLGQIGVDLMNARSEQRYNARQAAKSIGFLLNAGGGVQSAVVTQTQAGSILVGVPPQKNEDGTYMPVTLAWSGAAALDTGVYATIIDSAIQEARDLMVKQLSSSPDASAVSKDAGFAEGTSPLLARLAATQEQWINSALHFYALRSGIENPTVSLTMPRDFDLRNLIDDIDSMLDTLRKAALRSDSFVIDLVLRKALELGLIDEKSRPIIEAELKTSAQEAADRKAQEDDAIAALARGGTPPPAGTPNGKPAEPPVPAAA